MLALGMASVEEEFQHRLHLPRPVAEVSRWALLAQPHLPVERLQYADQREALVACRYPPEWSFSPAPTEPQAPGRLRSRIGPGRELTSSGCLKAV